MIFSLLFFSAIFVRALEPVASLDPIHAQSIYDSSVMQLIYQTVLNIDYTARPYKLSPGACELPTVSEDGLTYTFKLAPYDSNRARITAHDIVRSLSRLRDKTNVAAGSWTMNNVASIRALDENSVEFVLKKRTHIFPWLLTLAPTAIAGPNLEETGYFTLSKWRKNHTMEFTRRVPSKDSFNTVRYLTIADFSTVWLMFLKGELDYLPDIARDNWEAMTQPDGSLIPTLSNAGVKLFTSPSLDIRYIGFNMRDAIVGKNKKLRQALSCAFDFPTWKKFNNNRIEPANGPVPAEVDGYLDESAPYSYDLTRARQLLAEAGYPNGIDPKTGKRLVLQLSSGRANQESRETGELIAGFFEKIGVKLELSFNTWNAFLTSVNEGRTQLFMMGWCGDYPDAENFLQLFYSENRSPGTNHCDFINDAFDKAYENAMASISREERNKYWYECQRIVKEECPWIFMNLFVNFSLMHPRVGNYVPSSFPYGQERYFKHLKEFDK